MFPFDNDQERDPNTRPVPVRESSDGFPDHNVEDIRKAVEVMNSVYLDRGVMDKFLETSESRSIYTREGHTLDTWFPFWVSYYPYFSGKSYKAFNWALSTKRSIYGFEPVGHQEFVWLGFSSTEGRRRIYRLVRSFWLEVFLLMCEQEAYDQAEKALLNLCTYYGRSIDFYTNMCNVEIRYTMFPGRRYCALRNIAQDTGYFEDELCDVLFAYARKANPDMGNELISDAAEWYSSAVYDTCSNAFKSHYLRRFANGLIDHYSAQRTFQSLNYREPRTPNSNS